MSVLSRVLAKGDGELARAGRGGLGEAGVHLAGGPGSVRFHVGDLRGNPVQENFEVCAVGVVRQTFDPEGDGISLAHVVHYFQSGRGEKQINSDSEDVASRARGGAQAHFVPAGIEAWGQTEIRLPASDLLTTLEVWR